jgi:hypothetical protein
MRSNRFPRFACILLVFYANVCEPQNSTLTVSGYVKDAATGRPIGNAVVSVSGGAAKSDEPTDIHGRFILTLSRNINRGDNIRIQVSKSGYETYDEIVTVSNIALEFNLTPRLKLPKPAKRSPRRDKPGTSSVASNPLAASQPAPPNLDLGFRWDSQITVTDPRDEPVPGAHILLIAQNATYIEGLSDAKGLVLLKNQIGASPRTIFCAAPNFSAFLKAEYKVDERLVIKLRLRPHGGSIVILDGSGEVPGLMGMLNPILDTSNRTYLYGRNLAISGKQQPVKFTRNEPFDIEDNGGHHFRLTIVEIIDSSSLIDFERVN